MTRVSTRMVCVSPTRSNSRSCRARSSFTCRWGVVELISSRKIVPVWAASKRPVRLSIAPVNAPRTWPKSSLSSRLSLSAPQLTRTNGRLRRWLSSWIGVGDQLLAGAGFAQQQHRRAAARDLAREAVDLQHRRAGADDARQRFDRRLCRSRGCECDWLMAGRMRGGCGRRRLERGATRSRRAGWRRLVAWRRRATALAL